MNTGSGNQAHERLPNDNIEEANSLLKDPSTSINIVDVKGRAADQIDEHAEQSFASLSKAAKLDFMLLFLSKAVRMFSFGFFSVMLVEYLLQIGFNMREVGILFTW
jgi:hypothetical protein